MTAALANIIKKRSRTYVIERMAPVTTDPQTGRAVGGGITLGTLRCHIQPGDGARRVDGIAGVDTSGLIRIWVPIDVGVTLEIADDDDPEDAIGGDVRVDPGQGGNGSPGDHIHYDGHRWLVIERKPFPEDGSYRRYLARDEGALP
jgi:hypothetical protein